MPNPKVPEFDEACFHRVCALEASVDGAISALERGELRMSLALGMLIAFDDLRRELYSQYGKPPRINLHPERKAA